MKMRNAVWKKIAVSTGIKKKVQIEKINLQRDTIHTLKNPGPTNKTPTLFLRNLSTGL